VTLVAPNIVGTFASDIDDQARLGDADHDVVVEREGETETVEARAEVGAAGGHPHPRRRGPKRHAH
jgi:hypothetical protein